MKKHYLIGLMLMGALLVSGCGKTNSNSSSESSSDTSSIDSSSETSSSEESSSQYVPSDCTPIGEARETADGTEHQIYGVIAKFTYGYDGAEAFYLVDNTGSILVYASTLIAENELNVGYTIKVQGAIDHYQSEQESSVGQEIGYYGALQLVATSIEVVYTSVSSIPMDSVEETRIKYIAETDFREEDLTSRLFKVKATIVQDVQTGFTNYYFFDLSMDQSIYCYSKMSGSDFSWLAEYNNQSREVIIAVHSMRPRDEAWRIIPIEILDTVTISDEENATFALDRLEKQFLPTYSNSVKIELLSQDEKLLDEASVSYSTDSQYHQIVKENDKVYLSINGDQLGTFNITISLTYKSNTYSRTVTAEVIESQHFDTISVAEVMEAEEGEVVKVEGIYVKFAANTSAIYLADSTGILTVSYSSFNLEDYSEGETMVFEGTVTRDFVIDGVYEGHNRLSNATLLYHDGLNSEWDKSIVTGETTIENLYSNFTVDMIGNIYKVPGKIKLNETPYYSNIQIVDPDTDRYMTLYCSSANQLSWLFEYDGIVQDYYIYIRDSKSGSTARIEVIGIAE